jgi:hypothetical protein
MWRPRVLGPVIAERTLTLERPKRNSGTVRVEFGRPVRAPRPLRGDPWWCPVRISGLGRRGLDTIPGEDSLQALTLALEFVTRVLPLEASRGGARLQWLGERESLVFANTFACALLERNVQNCIAGMADAIAALETDSTGTTARATVKRLRALVASSGYTDDARRRGGRSGGKGKGPRTPLSSPS